MNEMRYVANRIPTMTPGPYCVCCNLVPMPNVVWSIKSFLLLTDFTDSHRISCVKISEICEISFSALKLVRLYFFTNTYGLYSTESVVWSIKSFLLLTDFTDSHRISSVKISEISEILFLLRS